MQTGGSHDAKAVYNGMLIHCDRFFFSSLIYSLSHSEYKVFAYS